MEWRHSIVWDTARTVFFLDLCFHAVVADHASLLMCMQEFLYIAYMLVNYALFYISNLWHIVFIFFR